MLTKLLLLQLMLGAAMCIRGHHSYYRSLSSHVTPVQVKQCSGKYDFVLHGYETKSHPWTFEVLQTHASRCALEDWHIEAEEKRVNNSKCPQGQSFSAVVTLTPPPRSPVPQDYALLGGLGYYKFYAEPRLWLEALLTCHDEGAHLVILNSPEEAKVIADLFAQYPISVLRNAQVSDPLYILIGFHEKFKRGRFFTIDGVPLEDSGYLNWYDNQPDNGLNLQGGEYCGGLHRSGRYDDIWCNKPNAFVCEIDI